MQNVQTSFLRHIERFWRVIIGFSLVAGLLFVGGVASAFVADEAPLRVGSKRFTESYVLAEVLAQTAASAAGGLTPKPVVMQGLGNTAIVFEALRAGNVDLYPEYAGTVALEILKGSAAMTLPEMHAALAKQNIGVGVPLGFNDGYALAMRAADAERMGVKTLSDLAAHAELRLGLTNEFIGRADGWIGLAKNYALTQKPVGLDHGLAYEAIAQKQIDVMDIYTTDAKINHLGLRVLVDDKKYFPRYDAVVLYRLDVPKNHPKEWAALQKLQGSISEENMIAMNARAELKGEPFDVIAKNYLVTKQSGINASAKDTPDAPRGFLSKLFGDDFWRLTRQHLSLVALSVALAALIGLPLAVWVFPHARIRAWVLGASGVLQTVPSLALLAILISVLGMIGTIPALVALTAYALLPIMRNTCAGLAEVSVGLRTAAEALGMTAKQRMRLIELPLAMPTIAAGLRTATSINVGTATIAAFVGAGGYGERIVTGLALNDSQLLLAGALPSALLAIVCELGFEAWERKLRRKTA